MSRALTASHFQVRLPLHVRHRRVRQAISPSSLQPRVHIPIKHGAFMTMARRTGRGSDGEEADDNAEEESKDVVEDASSVPPGASGTSQSSKSLGNQEEAVGPWMEDRETDIQTLKTSLLSTVAGYDRGSAAVAKDVAKIRSIVESLETLSGSVDLTGESKTQPSAEDLFNGTWKLIFTSSFRAGTRRPLIVTPALTLGTVYQVVDVEKRELDNVVDLLITSVPRFPWTPSNVVPKIRATLKHDMSYSMSIVSVTLKETIINILDAGFEIPKVTLPSLSSAVRSLTGRKSDGEFTLVYLDQDLRITEGDRSELRIFVKTPGLE